MKMMNSALSTGVALAAWALSTLVFFSATTFAQGAPKKVLVVTTTKGFRHSSIPTAEKVIGQLASQSGAFTVDYARVEPTDPRFRGPDGKPDKQKVDAAIAAVLAEKMNPAALKKLDAVIFANTTGDLPLPDKQAFLDWIKSGKGFVGMHSATDTFRGHTPLDPYVEMIGAEFKHHGAQAEVEANVQDTKCPACEHLGGQWKVFDEIYLFNGFDPSKVHRLLMLDKHPNDKTPGQYPISWCKPYGKGRVFYTSLGHREDVWDPSWPDRKNPKEVAEAYQASILHAIKWAVGLETWDVEPQKSIE